MDRLHGPTTQMRNIAFLYDPDRYWIEVVAGNTKV